MSDTAPSESFSAMLRRVLGGRLRPGAEAFTDMFCPDGVLEYPFAPVGLNSPIEGRDAIIENFKRLRTMMRVDSVSRVTEIAVLDPDTVVLEFTGRGEGVMTQEPYDQRYISVIHLRNGRIARYKDYWNPIALLAAINGHKTIQGLTVG